MRLLAALASITAAETELTDQSPLRSPSSPLNFKCDYGCDFEAFGTQIKLRKHYVTCHAGIHLKDDAVYCKDCYEVYPNTDELEDHYSTEHKHKLRKCQVSPNLLQDFSFENS